MTFAAKFFIAMVVWNFLFIPILTAFVSVTYKRSQLFRKAYDALLAYLNKLSQ